jgi:hypothetical protein
MHMPVLRIIQFYTVKPCSAQGKFKESAMEFKTGNLVSRQWRGNHAGQQNNMNAKCERISTNIQSYEENNRRKYIFAGGVVPEEISGRVFQVSPQESPPAVLSPRNLKSEGQTRTMQPIPQSQTRLLFHVGTSVITFRIGSSPTFKRAPAFTFQVSAGATKKPVAETTGQQQPCCTNGAS